MLGEPKQKMIHFLIGHTSMPYDTHSYARSSIFIINEGSLKISWGKKTIIDLDHRKNSALYIRKNDSFFSAASSSWKMVVVSGPLIIC